MVGIITRRRLPHSLHFAVVAVDTATTIAEIGVDPLATRLPIPVGDR